jgi:hypothetical protein
VKEASNVMKIRSQLEAMIAALEAEKDIVVLHAELGAKPNSDDLEALAEWFGGEIPAQFASLYTETNGIQLRWMSKHSARYTAAPDSFVRGPVAWGYARHDSSQNKHEDGVVIIPPVAELLAFDRANQFDGVEIDIDGEHVTDEEQLAESVLPFDWSSFYYLPSVFKFDGKVRVGSDHGIDFDGPVRTQGGCMKNSRKSTD